VFTSCYDIGHQIATIAAVEFAGIEAGGSTTVNWEIRYNPEEQIVESVFNGVVSGEDMFDAAQARIRKGKEHGISRFILDAKNMIAQRSATMDVFNIPTKMYQEYSVERTTRIAVIEPKDPDSAWVSQFYEDLCYTRGWSVKICRDRETAVAWLQED